MKKITAVIVLVLIIGGWSFTRGQEAHPASALAGDVDLLKRAFATTQAAPTNAEISGWAIIADDYYSPRKAEAAIAQMAAAFELNPNEYKVLLRSTGHYGYALVEYDLSENVWLRLQIQALDEETIASVEVRQKNHRGLDTVYLQVQSALLEAGAREENVNITSCLEGYLDARLKNSDILDKVYGAFNAVEAAYQEGIDTGGLAVWSGWSPLFAQSIDSGKKDVNFGISFRFESGRRGTIVRVATPVLPGSY